MQEPFRLDDKVAVVTGALGKLGPVWVEALLSVGAHLVGLDLPWITISHPFSVLQDRYGDKRLKLYQVDILDKTALKHLYRKIVDEVGVPSVLVNNAGMDQPPGAVKTYRLEDIPAEAFQSVLNVNVLGTFQVIQIFGADMVTARRGSIINIGSIYASVSPDTRFYNHLPCDPPFLKPPAYGASKSAVVNLTQYFAAHWGAYGVRVNTLSPGGVEGGQDEEFKRKFCDRVPLKKMAQTSDLIGPLIFLATDASSYVTGINLKVDGGFTIW